MDGKNELLSTEKRNKLTDSAELKKAFDKSLVDLQAEWKKNNVPQEKIDEYIQSVTKAWETNNEFKTMYAFAITNKGIGGGVSFMIPLGKKTFAEAGAGFA